MLIDRKTFSALLIFIFSMVLLFLPGNAGAAGEDVLWASTVEPDALILLDISYSMTQNPAGGTNIYGASESCTADTVVCASGSRYAASDCDTPNTGACVSTGTRYAASSTCTADNSTGKCVAGRTYYARSNCNTANTSNCTGSGCSGGFCNSSKTGCSVSCNTSDCSGGFCASLHMGCANNCTATCTGGFCSSSIPGCSVNCTASGSCSGGFCSSSGGGCTTNCSKLAIAKRAIFSMLDDNNDGTVNSADNTSLKVRMGFTTFSTAITNVKSLGSTYQDIFCGNSTSCASTATSCTSGSCVAGTSAVMYTALADALVSAKNTLDADTSASCRDKFVILLSDGADTVACGSTEVDGSLKKRRETVAKAKALKDAGYKLFVVGFGAGMPVDFQNNLNWMAYYGGTSNPDVAQTGSTTGYNIPAGSLYPTGITSCSTGSTSVDPELANLSGYAFIASDADDLNTALRRAMTVIRQAIYAFSVTSVSSARISSENNIYEASLQPIDNDSFWYGRLKKYAIYDNGSINTTSLWEAGTQLASRAASDRNIKTSLDDSSHALVAFGTAGTTPSGSITRQILGADNDTARDSVVKFIRGEATDNIENWKLGDVWHSNPKVLTSPSPSFVDGIDTSIPKAFSTFRTTNRRTSAECTQNTGGRNCRTVVLGANDGQFHAFETNTGSETFSFVPPNMLSKLKLISHSAHPTTLQHQYFVDGPISAADVWIYPSDSDNGSSKTDSAWQTLVVFGEGRGAGDKLWCSSANCAGDNVTFGSAYAAGTPNYCGYYAFDFTDTSTPVYKWRLNGVNASTEAPYLAGPWSRMAIGRVKIAGKERWVGFMGGGGYEYTCGDNGSTGGGKGFFVIDLKTGQPLWRYTYATNSAMNYALPAAPTMVDSDNDGFIDVVYLGDLGGNMWRFKFPASSSSTSDWSGGRFYSSSSGNIRPIYTQAIAGRDSSNNIWVYWGTGDKQCPKVTPASPNNQDFFYGVKENDNLTASHTISNVTSLVSTGTTTYTGSTNGFQIQFADTGEKMLDDPALFGGKLLFTTYVPPPAGADQCTQAGTSNLYVIDYMTGAGAFSAGAKKTVLSGTGIASAVTVSLRPDGTTADVYVTMSGGFGVDASTYKVPDVPLPSPPVSRSNMLYWKDRRMQ